MIKWPSGICGGDKSYRLVPRTCRVMLIHGEAKQNKLCSFAKKSGLKGEIAPEWGDAHCWWCLKELNETLAPPGCDHKIGSRKLVGISVDQLVRKGELKAWIRGLVLDVLNMRCLWGTQVVSQLEMWVWNLVEKWGWERMDLRAMSDSQNHERVGESPRKII